MWGPCDLWVPKSDVEEYGQLLGGSYAKSMFGI